MSTTDITLIHRILQNVYISCEFSFSSWKTSAVSMTDLYPSWWNRTRGRYFVWNWVINNHVGFVHKNHIIRTCLMYHAACKVGFQPFKQVVLTADVFQLPQKKYTLRYFLSGKTSVGIDLLFERKEFEIATQKKNVYCVPDVPPVDARLTTVTSISCRSL